MCCLPPPAQRTARAPGRALVCARGCSTRTLAYRLRRIGDQLEKRWGTQNKSTGPRTADSSVKGIHMMCAAIHVTVLVLFVGKRRL